MAYRPSLRELTSGDASSGLERTRASSVSAFLFGIESLMCIFIRSSVMLRHPKGLEPFEGNVGFWGGGAVGRRATGGGVDGWSGVSSEPGLGEGPASLLLLVGVGLWEGSSLSSLAARGV